jgi:hypothetical protein
MYRQYLLRRMLRALATILDAHGIMYWLEGSENIHEMVL